MNHRNRRTGHVISDADYMKLRRDKKDDYRITAQRATHRVDDDNNLLLIGTLMMMSSNNDNSHITHDSYHSHDDYSSHDSHSFHDSGGSGMD